MPKVLVIILNYRTAEMTLRAAEQAVAAMTDLDAELTIVDNASGDGSAETIARALAAAPWADPARVRLIRSEVNGGFGAGNNIAMRAGMMDGSRPDYVYLLNSDAFPEPDAIARLVTHLETHPEAGFAGSSTVGEDGALQVTAFRFPTLWSEFEGAIRTGPFTRLFQRFVVPMGVLDRNTSVDWLAGASMMMRQSVLDEIGLFDETFFLYFEETELCLRAVRAGYEMHFVLESRVKHIGAVSTGMKTWARVPKYWLDSRWYYFAKAYGRGYAALATVMHLLGGIGWRVRALIQRKAFVDPPRFLWDMAAHDLRALLGRPSETVRAQQRLRAPTE